MLPMIALESDFLGMLSVAEVHARSAQPAFEFFSSGESPTPAAIRRMPTGSSASVQAPDTILAE
jgi:hypothetical protein